VIALACGAAGVIILSISRQIDDQPRAVMSAQQLAEFESKKTRLDEAALLLNAGAYEESVKRYRELVRDYPDNVPALEGLRKAEASLEEKLRQTDAAQRRISEVRRPARNTSSSISTVKNTDKKNDKEKKEFFLKRWWKAIRS
jgi:tetratricopeptide (TPR) repeat protein